VDLGGRAPAVTGKRCASRPGRCDAYEAAKVEPPNQPISRLTPLGRSPFYIEWADDGLLNLSLSLSLSSFGLVDGSAPTQVGREVNRRNDRHCGSALNPSGGGGIEEWGVTWVGVSVREVFLLRRDVLFVFLQAVE
jgi:hypothetical protein